MTQIRHEMGIILKSPREIGQMREATGLSLAIGTLMLARKEILTEAGGVFGPEACLEPTRFLTYLKERGIESYFDLEMTRPVV